MATADKKSATATAVVANGRCIMGEGEKIYSAGNSISLPKDELARLMDLGFIAATDAIPAASVPSLTASDGPQIKVA